MHFLDRIKKVVYYIRGLFAPFHCCLKIEDTVLYSYVVNDRAINGWTLDDKCFFLTIFQFVQHFNNQYYLYWHKIYKVALTSVINFDWNELMFQSVDNFYLKNERKNFLCFFSFI